MRRVVVTGLGAISSIGHNVNESWNNLISGVNGIDIIKRFDVSNSKIKLAGEIKDYNPDNYFDKKQANRLSKCTQYALIAAREAYKDSKLAEFNHDRFGVIIGTGIGGIDYLEEQIYGAAINGIKHISPYCIPKSIANMPAGNIAIEFNARGHVTATCTACASATTAIGDGFRLIKDNYLDVMIVGGAESPIVETMLRGFQAMHALSSSKDRNRASIPFDNDRSGFVMSEGAGMLILEELEHAKKRNAHIYGEVVGYGSTCDAYDIIAPNGEGGMRAIKEAIEAANVDLNKNIYINAHGTGTKMNDKYEAIAIKKLFGEKAYKIPISSTKSSTGHALGAAGGLEAIFCLKAIENSIVPATINYQNIDPECNLDVVPNTPRKYDIDYTISNSFGFGGHNAVLVMKKYVGE